MLHFLRSVLLLIGLPVIGISQTTQWTLDDCIQYALENNITVQQIQLNVKSSQANLQQSKMERYPSLSGSASYYYNHGRTVDPTTYTFQSGSFSSPSLSLSSNVTLFDGFRISNTIDQNEEQLKADEYDLEGTKQSVAITITRYYLDALLAKEQLEVSQNQLETVKEQLENTRKLVDAGSLPEGELFNLEAQVSQAEFDVVSAENQLELNMVNLQLAMLRNPSDEFQIVEPAEDIETNFLDQYDSPEAVINDALNAHPSIRSAEYQMRSAATGIAIAKGNLMPTVNLSGSLNTSSSSSRNLYDAIPQGYDTIGSVAGSGEPVVSDEIDFRLVEQNYPVLDQFKDNFNQTISLQVNIPIFNGFRARNSVTQAEINKKRAELQLEQTETDLRNNVYQSYANARAAKNRYAAAQKNVRAARKSFEYTQKKADQGLVRPIDFQNAQTDLQRAESNMIQAKYQYLMSIRILNYYLGRSLKTQN